MKQFKQSEQANVTDPTVGVTDMLEQHGQEIELHSKTERTTTRKDDQDESGNAPEETDPIETKKVKPLSHGESNKRHE